MNQLIHFNNIEALNRALIGFDTMFDNLERRFATQAAATNYPPHNVLKTGDDQYEIQLAVTGFEKNEITVEIEDNVITVKGENSREEDENIVYLHRGLATRNFVRQFPLAEHMELRGATMKNGMLSINIVRNLPESAKPRVIDIVEVK